MSPDEENELAEPHAESEEQPLVVPWERLSEEALLGVLTEFVTREGTEYGEHDVSLDTKLEQVRTQLTLGSVVVVFDARSQSVNLVHATDLASHSARRPR